MIEYEDTRCPKPNGPERTDLRRLPRERRNSVAEEIIRHTMTQTHSGARLGSIGEIFRDTAGEAYGKAAEESERRGRALLRKRASAAAFASIALSLDLARKSVDRKIPLSLRRLFTVLLVLVKTAAEATTSAASAVFNEIYCLYYRVSDRFSRFSAARAVAAIFLAASAAVVISTSIVGVGLQVYIDGAPIGFIRAQQDFTEVVASVEQKASDILGYPYTLRSDIRYEFNMVNRSDMLDLHDAEAALFAEISDIKRLYVLTIDGERVAANPDKSVISESLDELLAPYRTGDENETVSFVQDYTLSLEYTNADSEMGREEIGTAVRKYVREAELYTIASGDTLTGIAKSHGLAQETLSALNPDVSATSLKAGEVLTVENALPLLSVKVVKQLIYDVSIPHETERINDDTLYVGTTRVKVEGVDGMKEVTADVTYLDGVEQGREILSEVVKSDPVTEVLRVGTKKRVATGSFMRPFNGSISSYFGYRTFRGRGDYHTGVDFTGPGARGKIISASDGGTVTFSGWKGNYGNLVIIDHGNGFTTYYAHCQSLLVSVGQKVAKGESIARIGSTGRSTGPHVHFEIRINGNPVNPMNYLR